MDDRAPSMNEDRAFRFPFEVALAGLAVFVAFGWLQYGRALNWDEIEYFRATRWIAAGSVPYVDFWEHHAPLQWIIFSPLASFADGAGVVAVVAMRWAQIPLWVATFVIVFQLMRQNGLSGFARWTSLAILLSSPAFVLFAVEYRVDTLSTFFFVVCLWAWHQGHSRAVYSLVAGFALSASVLSNIRMGPLGAIVFLLLALLPRLRGAALWLRLACVGAGAALPVAALLTYLGLAGGLRNAYEQLIVQNTLADALLPDYPLLTSMAGILGLSKSNGSSFAVYLDPDLAALALGACGLAGAFVVSRAWRRQKGARPILVFVQIVNILAILRMKALFGYHFQLVWILMVPLCAILFDDLARRFGVRRLAAIVLAVVGGVSVQNTMNLVSRNTRDSLEYQDRVMVLANSATEPTDEIWDGVGFVLNRAPSYEYWFLPAMVRLLAHQGAVPPYGSSDLLADPPAAVIYSQRTYLWLESFPELKETVVTHYVPVLQHLWMPGLSVRMDHESGQASWTAPVEGSYGVYAASFLHEHMWFDHPLEVGVIEHQDRKRLELTLPPTPRIAIDGQLSVIVNGRDLGQVEVFEAEKRDQVVIRWTGLANSAGLFALPRPYRRLFEMPDRHASLDVIGRRFE